MNYYVLPETTIHGGNKVGFQFCDLLSRLGVKIAVATPEGFAPNWLTSIATVIPFDRMKDEVSEGDTILFSLPHHHEMLKALPGRLIFHCQGTDPLIDPVIADPDLVLLSCWPQAQAYMKRRTGREPIDVGISISDCFFYDGAPKRDDLVAFMPRRGAAIAAECQKEVSSLSFLAIDNQIEPECARSMKRSGWYLGASVGEWFGLPSLEAMAAGCLVASVPVIGGMDYLVPDRNCIMGEPSSLPGQIAWMSGADQRDARACMRQRGLETAQRFRMTVQRRKLAGLLRGPLREHLSWA